MESLHPALAPLIAAWMGGALLSLATAGLKSRLGVRARPAHAAASAGACRRPRAARAHR